MKLNVINYIILSCSRVIPLLKLYHNIRALRRITVKKEVGVKKAPDACANRFQRTRLPFASCGAAEWQTCAWSLPRRHWLNNWCGPHLESWSWELPLEKTGSPQFIGLLLSMGGRVIVALKTRGRFDSNYLHKEGEEEFFKRSINKIYFANKY